MTFDEGMQHLRELLERPAAWEHWEELCKELDAWTDDAEREVAIDYIDGHISHWKDELREGPVDTWWPDFPFKHPKASWHLVRCLNIADRILIPTELAALLESPQIQRCKIIYLERNDLTHEAAHAIAQSESLQHIEGLSLEGNDIGATGVKALANSPHFPHLIKLYLSETNLGEDGLRALSHAPFFPQLKILHLGDNNIDKNTLQALTSGPDFPQLRDLTLRSNPLSGGLKPLLEAIPGPLTELTLSGCGLRPQDLTALARAIPRLQLQALAISSNPHIKSEGCKRLAKAKGLEQLEELLAYECLIEDQGLQHLAESEGLHQLKSLCIGSNSISPDGIQALATTQSLTQLSKLFLEQNDLGHLGIEALIEAPFLPHLEEICLYECQLYNTGIERLVSTVTFPTLHTLMVGRNWFAHEGLIALGESTRFPRLQELSLVSNQVEHEGSARFFHGPLVKQVRALDLRWCGIDNKHLLELSQVPDLQLRELRLQGNAFSSRGIQYLLRAPWFPQLELLRLGPLDNCDILPPTYKRLLATCEEHKVRLDFTDIRLIIMPSKYLA